MRLLVSIQMEAYIDKMSWNLRVIATEEPMIGGPAEIVLSLHEVYYGKDGKPNSLTKNPIRVSGESLEALEWYINKMKDALKKPIIWGDHRWPQEFNKEDYENNK